MWGTWRRRASLLVMTLVVVAGAVWAFWPAPVPVDLATVVRGPLEVTVGEEGRTRVREIYVVSAPVAGRLQRSPLEVGDEVKARQTVVAVIRPTPPEFLDERRRIEEQARVRAAEAVKRLAEAEVNRANAELSFAIRELNRAKGLAETDFISERALEEARLSVDIKRAALMTAEANLAVRTEELESARARLIGPEMATANDDGSCCVTVRAPVDGRVLEIMAESERVVSAGTPLVEIGDPHDLEIVVELLTLDAVKVEAGDRAYVEGWGGEETFPARVRRVDPAGFKKVSALGIEEQRVLVVLDPVPGSEGWERLGHDFRVFVRIVVWEAEDALQVPLSALFREAGGWAVFALADGRAVTTSVMIGERNDRVAEVLDGLTEGDSVVVHPSDRVADGVTIVSRPE